MNNKYCIILAGGIGSRLWPTSRQACPKQFLDILGTGETLLQSTYRRYLNIIPKENIIVVSNEAYADLINQQLPDIPQGNVLLEPMRRNTVTGVIWAAFEVSHRTKGALMVVTPSDQVISNEAIFQADIEAAFQFVADNDNCLSIGVVPTHPETTFGYIQMSSQLGSDETFSVQSFTEKPNADFAKLFHESGEFLWNTGIFLWKATVFIEAIRKIAPEFSIVEHDYDEFLHNRVLTESMLDNIYAICPSMSLEQAILDKPDGVAVKRCHFTWNDIGTWDQIYGIKAPEANANVTLNGDSMFFDCQGCMVKTSDGKMVVLQGLTDYVVVEEGNVLMVCKRDDQQAVRKFVNDIQVNEKNEYL